MRLFTPLTVITILAVAGIQSHHQPGSAQMRTSLTGAIPPRPTTRTLPATSQPGNAIGELTDIDCPSGRQVRLIHNNNPTTVKRPTSLSDGDEIRIPVGCSAKVRCSGFTGQGRGERQSYPLNGRPETYGRLCLTNQQQNAYANADRAAKRKDGRDTGISDVKGNDKLSGKPYGLFGYFLLEAPPEFRWQRVSKAIKYEVELLDEGTVIKAFGEVQETRISSSGAPSLEAGREYTLMVVATIRQDGKDVQVSHDTPFRLIDDPERLRQEVRAIKGEGADLGGRRLHTPDAAVSYQLAVLYLSHGLFAEAIPELEKLERLNPDGNSEVRRWLKYARYYDRASESPEPEEVVRTLWP